MVSLLTIVIREQIFKKSLSLLLKNLFKKTVSDLEILHKTYGFCVCVCFRKKMNEKNLMVMTT